MFAKQTLITINKNSFLKKTSMLDAFYVNCEKWWNGVHFACAIGKFGVKKSMLKNDFPAKYKILGENVKIGTWESKLSDTAPYSEAWSVKEVFLDYAILQPKVWEIYTVDKAKKNN